MHHLYAVRLHTQPDMAEQATLLQAVQHLADERERALADPQLDEPARKMLQSMTAHWSGLTVFVDAPWVRMANNAAERDLRGPVVARKNFFGSGAR